MLRAVAHTIPALLSSLNDPRQSHRRVQAVVLFVAIAIHLLHQYWFVDWYIDDAVISFSYARNFAEGEWLVAFPGVERVEGYSNLLWVLVLTVF